MQVTLSKEDLINLVRWTPISEKLNREYIKLGWGGDCYYHPFVFHDSVLDDLSEQELWELYLKCKNSYAEEKIKEELRYQKYLESKKLTE